ncbi:MAG: hypothetical protein ACT4PX_10280 [Actinomycetota bacterium]
MVAVVGGTNVAVAVGIVRMSSSPTFFLTSLALASTLVVLGVLRPSQRTLAFRSAAVVEFLLGLIGLFTVGVPLLVASMVLFAAADLREGVEVP